MHGWRLVSGNNGGAERHLVPCDKAAGASTCTCLQYIRMNDNGMKTMSSLLEIILKMPI